MVNSYCVTCKSKTSWARVLRRYIMKNNVLMLEGRCNVCGKGKSAIASQFKKKQPEKKPKITKEYKSKRTGPTSVYEGLNALAKSGLGGGNRATRFGWPPPQSCKKPKHLESTGKESLGPRYFHCCQRRFWRPQETRDTKETAKAYIFIQFLRVLLLKLSKKKWWIRTV